MLTIDKAVKRYGVEVEAEYAGDDPIPVHDGLQFQGDVAIVPTTGTATGVIPVEGVTFDLAEDRSESLTLGILTVAKKAVAYLAHPQHGYAGIGPGSYELRRQREQADEIRRVQD